MLDKEPLLERHSSNQHWRKNPVILSGSATSAGISHASLTLKTVGMADLLDGVKSDANRTFDYLNGALVLQRDFKARKHIEPIKPRVRY